MNWLKNAYKILFGKTQNVWKRERPRDKWKDGIKLDIKKTVLDLVDWIHQAQDWD
jgi:hypothetical protein